MCDKIICPYCKKETAYFVAGENVFAVERKQYYCETCNDAFVITFTPNGKTIRKGIIKEPPKMDTPDIFDMYNDY